MTFQRGRRILRRMRACSLSRCLVALAATWLLVMPSHAMDIETYDKQVRLPANSLAQIRLSSYLLGIGEGLRLANEALKSRGSTALFCAPEAAPLFAADVKKLIDGVLAVSRATLQGQGASIEQILLRALQEAHPCSPPLPVTGSP
jgi:hypothetical protein